MCNVFTTWVATVFEQNQEHICSADPQRWLGPS